MDSSNPEDDLSQHPPDEDVDDEDDGLEDLEEDSEEDEIEALEAIDAEDPSVSAADLRDKEKLLLAKARHDRLEIPDVKPLVQEPLDSNAKRAWRDSEDTLATKTLEDWAGQTTESEEHQQLWMLMKAEKTRDDDPRKEIARRAEEIRRPAKKNTAKAARSRKKRKPLLEEPFFDELASDPRYVPPARRKLLKYDISEGVNGHPIAVYCDVGDDTDDLPEIPRIQYIQRNEGYRSDSSAATYQCNCSEGCDEESCECIRLNVVMNQNNGPFLKDGKILIKRPTTDVYSYALLTCGELCGCPPECPNRVENRLKRSRLEVFRKNGIVGFGVRTLTSIGYGEPVSEFTGVVKESEVSEDYAMELGSPDEGSGCCIGPLVDQLKVALPNIKQSAWNGVIPQTDVFIDPLEKGNETRFLSHGCLPNLQLIRVISNFIATERHRLVFYANRTITAGSELTFNYGAGYVNRAKWNCQCGTLLCKNNQKTWNVICVDLKKIRIFDVVKQVRQKRKLVARRADRVLGKIYYEAKKRGFYDPNFLLDNLSDEFWAFVNEELAHPQDQDSVVKEEVENEEDTVDTREDSRKGQKRGHDVISNDVVDQNAVLAEDSAKRPHNAVDFHHIGIPKHIVKQEDPDDWDGGFQANPQLDAVEQDSNHVDQESDSRLVDVGQEGAKSPTDSQDPGRRGDDDRRLQMDEPPQRFVRCIRPVDENGGDRRVEGLQMSRDEATNSSIHTNFYNLADFQLLGKPTEPDRHGLHDDDVVITGEVRRQETFGFGWRSRLPQTARKWAGIRNWSRQTGRVNLRDADPGRSGEDSLESNQNDINGLDIDNNKKNPQKSDKLHGNQTEPDGHRLGLQEDDVIVIDERESPDDEVVVVEEITRGDSHRNSQQLQGNANPTPFGFQSDWLHGPAVSPGYREPMRRTRNTARKDAPIRIWARRDHRRDSGDVLANSLNPGRRGDDRRLQNEEPLQPRSESRPGDEEGRDRRDLQMSRDEDASSSNNQLTKNPHNSTDVQLPGIPRLQEDEAVVVGERSHGPSHRNPQELQGNRSPNTHENQERIAGGNRYLPCGRPREYVGFDGKIRRVATARKSAEILDWDRRGGRDDNNRRDRGRRRDAGSDLHESMREDSVRRGREDSPVIPSKPLQYSQISNVSEISGKMTTGQIPLEGALSKVSGAQKSECFWPDGTKRKKISLTFNPKIEPRLPAPVPVGFIRVKEPHDAPKKAKLDEEEEGRHRQKHEDDLSIHNVEEYDQNRVEKSTKPPNHSNDSWKRGREADSQRNKYREDLDRRYLRENMMKDKEYYRRLQERFEERRRRKQMKKLELIRLRRPRSYSRSDRSDSDDPRKIVQQRDKERRRQHQRERMERIRRRRCSYSRSDDPQKRLQQRERREREDSPYSPSKPLQFSPISNGRRGGQRSPSPCPFSPISSDPLEEEIGGYTKEIQKTDNNHDNGNGRRGGEPLLSPCLFSPISSDDKEEEIRGCAEEIQTVNSYYDSGNVRGDEAEGEQLQKERRNSSARG